MFNKGIKLSEEEIAESERNIEHLIQKMSYRMAVLYRMKERGRIVLGNLINSEILNFNNKNQKVDKFSMTYTLNITGTFDAKIYLNLEPEAALHITDLLFKQYMDVNPKDWSEQAMKEILNIFSGHLVTFFDEYGYTLDIGVPSDTDHDFIKSKPRRKILFRFKSDNHIIQFIIEID
ncbi:MAG: hypothetical protein OEZ13_04850 [Spirochaetia bacterium]|nr:hypothetical protein [Spirochaetia bacterium]